jgi:hypothetical protein
VILHQIDGLLDDLERLLRERPGELGADVKAGTAERLELLLDLLDLWRRKVNKESM